CGVAAVKPRLYFRGGVSRRFTGVGTTALCRVLVGNPDLRWATNGTVSDSLVIAAGARLTLGTGVVVRLNGQVFNRGGVYDGTAGATWFGGSGTTRLVSGIKGAGTRYAFGKVRRVGPGTTCLRYPVRIEDSLLVTGDATLEIAPVADTLVVVDVLGDVVNEGTITAVCGVSLPRPVLRFRGAVRRRFTGAGTTVLCRLVIDKTGGDLTLVKNITVQDSLIVNLNTTLTIINNVFVDVSGSCRVDGTFEGTDCRVVFRGTGDQSVRGGGLIRFGDWTLAGGTNTFIAPNCGVRVPGAFTIDPGCGLQLNGGTLYLGGTYVSNGTFSNGAGTVVFDGTVPQDLTGDGFTRFGNLVIDNPAGCNGFDGNDIDGDFTIRTGARFTTPAFGTITVGGDFINDGTFADTAGTTLFDGSGPQQIAGASNTLFVNLTVDNPAGLALSVPGRVCKLLHLRNGDLRSDGNLRIVSDERHTGMVNNEGGAVTGTAAMERYARAPGYHYFSSTAVGRPVREFEDDMDFVITHPYSPYGSPAGEGPLTRPFPTLFVYDEGLVPEAGDTLGIGGWQTPTGPAAVMPAGRGYALNLPADATVDIAGVLHNGNLSWAGLTRGNGTARGWNLVGNPYPSPLRWSQVGKTNVEDGLYFFRPNSQYEGEYFSYVNGIGTGRASDTVASMQGVFVRVGGAGAGQLDFSNAARVTEYADPVFFRTTGGPLSEMKNGLVRLRLLGPGGADAETVVYFEQGATDGFDSPYDAHLFGKNTGRIPTVWTTDAAGEERTINGFAPLVADKTVPVRVALPDSGRHTFRALDLWYFDSTATVFLEDVTAGVMHDLTAKGAYAFDAPAGEDTARFRLHFTPGIATSAGGGTDRALRLSVYPNPAQSYFVVAYGNAGRGQRITLYNVQGRTMWSGETGGAFGEVEVPTTALPSGVYVLRFATGEGFVNRKVVVTK
ncbi:MAG: T9SS type A sorting domain-containing protein, partial [Catalinimonas sp.]